MDGPRFKAALAEAEICVRGLRSRKHVIVLFFDTRTIAFDGPNPEQPVRDVKPTDKPKWVKTDSMAGAVVKAQLDRAKTLDLTDPAWLEIEPRVNDNIKAAGRRAEDADTSESAFHDTVALLAESKGKSKTDDEAKYHTNGRLNATLGAVQRVVKRQDAGKSATDLTPSLNSLGNVAATDDERKAIGAAKTAADADPQNPAEAKAKNADPLKAGGKVLTDADKSTGLPAGDGELTRMAKRGEELALTIRNSKSNTPERKAAMSEFAKLSDEADKRIAKLSTEGVEVVDKIAGPAIAIATSVGAGESSMTRTSELRDAP